MDLSCNQLLQTNLSLILNFVFFHSLIQNNVSVDIVVIISESSQQVEITLKTNIHHKCWSNIGYCLILSVCSVVCYSGSVKSLSLYKICKRFLKNLLSYPHSCFLCWLMNAGQNSVLKTGRHRDSQTSEQYSGSHRHIDRL